jgi:hypothetical protein
MSFDQLCDATVTMPDGLSLALDGLNNRHAPGGGDFPIDEIILERTLSAAK